MKNQLVVLENLKPVSFFTKGDDVDHILEKIKKDALLHVPDLSTGKGRAAITANITRVTESKTYLEAKGKELAVEYKAIPAKIDQNRKKVKDFLAELQVELRKPLTDWEAEQEKIKADKLAAAEVEKLNAQHEIALLLNKEFDRDAEDERLKLEAEQKIEDERLEKLRIEDEARIKKEAAEAATKEAELLAQKKIDDAQAAKQKAIDDKIKADNALIESQAEQKRLEAQAEQTRLNNEWLAYISEAYQINDQLNAEAEQKRQADIAEQNRLNSIENERLAGIERQRLAQKKLDDEAAARAANTKHKASVNNAIMSVLLNAGIDKESAKKMVILAAKGHLPKLTINY